MQLHGPAEILVNGRQIGQDGELDLRRFIRLQDLSGKALLEQPVGVGPASRHLGHRVERVV